MSDTSTTTTSETTTTSGSTASTTTTTAAATSFSLTATNQSTVPGKQYFNVYPLACTTVVPSMPCTLVPTVSAATVAGTTSAVATVTWQGGAGGMTLVVPASGTSPTAVALGDTVTITYADSAYTLSSVPGTSSTVTIVLATGTSMPASIGLTTGAGMISLAPTSSTTTITLTPDLTPTVNVQFGSAYDPLSGTSDLSQMVAVTFTGTTSLQAGILVGPANTITQTS